MRREFNNLLQCVNEPSLLLGPLTVLEARLIKDDHKEKSKSKFMCIQFHLYFGVTWPRDNFGGV